MQARRQSCCQRCSKGERQTLIRVLHPPPGPCKAVQVEVDSTGRNRVRPASLPQQPTSQSCKIALSASVCELIPLYPRIHTPDMLRPCSLSRSKQLAQAEVLAASLLGRYLHKIWVKSSMSELKSGQNKPQKARTCNKTWFPTKARECDISHVRSKACNYHVLPLVIKSQETDLSCLQCMSYLKTPVASTEGIVLSTLSYILQIDTFGKWLRCLTNVCYVNTNKLRYLDKLR